MTDQFRAMCAELLAWAERTSSHYYKQADVVIRARDLLAQPVAEGPSDEELDVIERQCAGCEYLLDHRRFARAVLARWGHPTPQPEGADAMGTHRTC
jgi:hypothetical protein